MWDLASGAVVRQQADRHASEPVQPYIDALYVVWKGVNRA